MINSLPHYRVHWHINFTAIIITNTDTITVLKITLIKSVPMHTNHALQKCGKQANQKNITFSGIQLACDTRSQPNLSQWQRCIPFLHLGLKGKFNLEKYMA